VYFVQLIQLPGKIMGGIHSDHLFSFLTFKTWNFIGSLNYDFARYSQTYSYELNTQKRNFTIDHDLRFLGYNFGIAKLFCLTPNLTLNFGISLGITKSLNNSTKIRLTKGSGITNEYLLYDFDFWRRQEIGASVSGSLNYSFGNFSEIQGAIVFEKNSRQFIEASISDESSNRELLFFSNVPIPLNRFGVSITYKRYLRVHSIHHLK